METRLKTISKDGIPEAISKVELYRSLNDPEGAESICQDVLAIEPDHQIAIRMLGLTITDQFTGHPTDRYSEAERRFAGLADPYERHYYLGLLNERRARAQMRAGQTARTTASSLHEAMVLYEEAERIHPPQNDDAVLRWNRCARLLEKLGQTEETEPSLHDDDTAPIEIMQRPRRVAG